MQCKKFLKLYSISNIYLWGHQPFSFAEAQGSNAIKIHPRFPLLYTRSFGRGKFHTVIDKKEVWIVSGCFVVTCSLVFGKLEIVQTASYLAKKWEHNYHCLLIISSASSSEPVLYVEIVIGSCLHQYCN